MDPADSARAVPEVVVQSGHVVNVLCSAFSPDGRLVATGSADETVRLWGMSLGCELRVLLGHQGPVYDVRFDPPGRWLASAGYDGTVRLWDVQTGTARRPLRGARQPLGQVCFDGGGGRLAAGSQDVQGLSWAFVWDAATGKRTGKWAFKTPRGAPHVDSRIALSPCGRFLARHDGISDATVVYEADGGAEAARFPGPPTAQEAAGADPVYGSADLAYSPDGRWLAVDRSGRGLQIIDLATGRDRDEPPAGRAFDGLEFLPDGTFVGYRERTVELWDVATARRRRTIRAGARAISPDRKLVADHDGRLLLLKDAATARTIRTLGARSMWPKEGFGNRSRPFLLAANPMYPMLASSSHDGLLRLWDLRSGRGPAIVPAHDGMIGTLAFHPRGDRIATAAWGSLKFWSAPEGAPRDEFELGFHVRYLDFSPDGRFLFGAGERAMVLDLEGRSLRTFDYGLGREVVGVASAPQGGHFSVANRE
jgi:WD40 repeat protein